MDVVKFVFDEEITLHAENVHVSKVLWASRIEEHGRFVLIFGYGVLSAWMTLNECNFLVIRNVWHAMAYIINEIDNFDSVPLLVVLPLPVFISNCNVGYKLGDIAHLAIMPLVFCVMPMSHHLLNRCVILVNMTGMLFFHPLTDLDVIFACSLGVLLFVQCILVSRLRRAIMRIH